MRARLFSLFGAGVRAGIHLGYNLMEAPRTKGLYDRAYDRLRPLGPTQTTVRGHPFWVDADARGLAPKLLLLGTYEPHLTRVIERAVRPGMTVLDIGANIGYFTAIAAERSGPDGRVIAFEPDPQNLVLLERNAPHMGPSPVELHGCALSDHDGSATLYRDFRSSSRSTLVSAAVRRPGGEIDVPLRTLNGFFGCSDQRIDFIKMDAEGSEGAIVLGGRQTIERWRPVIIMEFWPYAMKENGTDPEVLLSFLRCTGYDFFLISPTSELEPVQPEHLVCLAMARHPSGQAHLDLLLRPSRA